MASCGQRSTSRAAGDPSAVEFRPGESVHGGRLPTWETPLDEIAFSVDPVRDSFVSARVNVKRLLGVDAKSMLSAELLEVDAKSMLRGC
eukprot:3859304-Pyramimonas_sp.AAC.1